MTFNTTLSPLDQFGWFFVGAAIFLQLSVFAYRAGYICGGGESTNVR